MDGGGKEDRGGRREGEIFGGILRSGKGKEGGGESSAGFGGIDGGGKLVELLEGGLKDGLAWTLNAVFRDAESTLFVPMTFLGPCLRQVREQLRSFCHCRVY